MIFNKRRETDMLLPNNHQLMLINIDSFDICEKLLERERERERERDEQTYLYINKTRARARKIKISFSKKSPSKVFLHTDNTDLTDEHGFCSSVNQPHFLEKFYKPNKF